MGKEELACGTQRGCVRSDFVGTERFVKSREEERGRTEGLVILAELVADVIVEQRDEIGERRACVPAIAFVRIQTPTPGKQAQERAPMSFRR